ncbi:MAG: hypothetical protein KDC88_02435 [Ignavibacteriae bacterium]|nr:hypothetical protein [Ignavibacteriota bacterium]MCB9208978.1 hypothetical protein [Ignavibacteriales bacterium]MCB9260490.1 hypothetical protein [Ignavibacteriales bacterium]
MLVKISLNLASILLYRPTNNFAAHGYGPVFLAGAEIIRLLDLNKFHLEEGALQLKK